MKQLQSSGVLIAGAALSLLMSQPTWAVATRVTGVRLNPTDRGLNVILETASGDRPQVFTGTRGNALVADVINTQLSLAQGNNFRQNNPAPGIASVVITRLDANSIRIIITGTNSAPSGQITQRSANNLTLSFSPAGTASTTPAAPAAVTAAAPSPTPTPSSAVSPPPIASPSPAVSPPPIAPASPQPQLGPGQTPALTQQPVLVPNPQITIDGKPAPAAGTAQPVSVAPPFLPRAVAPPVGDVAVSNIDASPSVIDLGTVERVPRLVLRDAPVREVLALLARAASLNLVFTGAAAQTRPGQPTAAAATGTEGPTISLDVENESVQDTFNNVLRLSGLEANRSGRSIFVGPRLPNEVRDTVVRSLRMNQVTVGVALNLLVGLGAESAVSRDRQITTVSAVPVGGGAPPATTTQTTTETRLETQRVSFQDSRQLLVGLEALGDERTNSVTLIGTAKQVDIATAQLVRLDGRRRQVAVNVKVVDVNLSASDLFNTSFSFGIGNNFFDVSGGNATVNVGGSRPPTSTETATATTSTPVVANQYNGTPFVNPNQPIQIQGASPGTTVVNNSTTPRQLNINGSGLTTFQPGVTFIPASGSQQTTTFQPTSPASTNPLQPGFTNITQPTQNTVTIDQSGNITSSQGTAGTVTTALPSLYQFPKRFLATLQASVTNGNAKILTDPTLIVQEGQTANVNLTQQVVGNIATQTNFTAGAAIQTVNVTKEQVGLTLNIRIERIDDNGFVSLSVAPVVRAPQSSQTINLGQGNTQTIVLINERSLNSGLIRLRDSQTLVLSGIIQDQDQTSVTKVPILGDIPILGALFRSTNRTNQRQEVIVLLTPQILDDSERSTFGYNYTPSPEVRQILERRGLKIPQK